MRLIGTIVLNIAAHDILVLIVRPLHLDAEVPTSVTFYRIDVSSPSTAFSPTTMTLAWSMKMPLLSAR